jgi:FG-GAP-like repeat
MHLVFMLMCVMLVTGTSAAQMCAGPSFKEQRVAFGTPLTDIAAGDIDQDGDLDLIVSAETTFVVFNPGNGDFANATQIDLGEGGYRVRVADLNNDSIQDVIYASLFDDLVVVLGLGGGLFGEAELYGTGGGSGGGFDLFDIDTDGDLDVVIANAFSDTVSVLENQGSGDFLFRNFISVCLLPGDVVMGDLDSDGVHEMAVMGSVNEICILAEDIHGNYSINDVYQVGSNPTVIETVDIDSDGDLDLVTVNRTSSTISLLINNGKGIMSPIIEMDVGSGPRAVGFVDYNLDGNLDIVVANRLGDDLSVYENSGDNVFAMKDDIPVGFRPTGVCIGDFDDDGDSDLVVENSGDDDISILWNQCNLNQCNPDFTGEGDLNFLDLSAFLAAFASQDPIADFEPDGNFNFLDVSAYLSAFAAGCP